MNETRRTSGAYMHNTQPDSLLSRIFIFQQAFRVTSKIFTISLIGFLFGNTVQLHAAPPYAATQPAMAITSTNATINGMATPNGNDSVAWFEWGTNGSYGLTTMVTNVSSGSSVVWVSSKISNLVLGEIYFYRLVVSNADGLTYGAGQRFTTGRGVLAWGDNSINQGQLNVPANLSNVVAIAGGGIHVLALKNDGAVTAWGDNTFDETNVPIGLSNVVAIWAAGTINMAMVADGSIVSWGMGSTNVPIGVSNVVEIAIGYLSDIALKTDGTIIPGIIIIRA